MRYRGEIDGLRAVAVIPVIFFHAGFRSFEGGFVGVDVFFVISGYLITTIILSELSEDKFSIIQFYERRVRRILPALFFVMAVSLPIAWFTLMPADLRDFAQSLVGVSLFSSNILFWTQSGYFDTAAELKPLLHTWSLAVEEQFYVFFPLFLILAWRLGKRHIFGILIVVSLLSILLTQFLVTLHPAATFFLLPTRAWELAIGALVALILSRNPAPAFPQPAAQLLSLLGLAMIAYSVMAYDPATPFPSVYALAPTVGTALVILFAQPTTVVGTLLCNRFVVGVGLVSYSAYLWHQPLFAFARHVSLDAPGVEVYAVLIALTALLAYLSWRYVERPFRQRGLGRAMVFSFAATGSVLFLSAGVAGVLFDGFAQRLNHSQIALTRLQDENRKLQQSVAFDRFRCFLDQTQPVSLLVENKCVQPTPDQPRIILFGDSEAAHYLEGATTYATQHGATAQQWTSASCRAIDHRYNSERCRIFYKEFFRYVAPELTDKDTLIVSSYWLGTHRGLGDDDFRSAVHEMLSKLSGTPARIVLIGAGPDFIKPFERLIRANYDMASKVPQYLAVESYSGINKILKEEAARFGVSYFDPSERLCDGGATPRCLFADNVDFVFFDSGHLSYYGSRLVFNEMMTSIGTR